MMEKRSLRGLALIVLCLGLIGCDDDDSSTGPCVCDAGYISGTIQGGAGPISARVFAEPLSDWYGPWVRTYVETDSAGVYTLEVPEGPYCLYAFTHESATLSWYYSSGGPVLWVSEADSLYVAAGETRTGMDFLLGSIELTVSVPPELDGTKAYLYLDYPEPPPGEDPIDAPYNRIWATDGFLSGFFSGVVAGDYRLRLKLVDVPHVNDYQVMRLYTADAADSTSEIVAVQAGAIAERTAALLDPPAVIAGRFAGAWETLGFFYSRLGFFADDSTRLFDIRSNTDGTFRQEFYGFGPVCLLVTTNEIDRWVGGPNFASATRYSLQVGTLYEDLELRDCGIHLGLTNSDATDIGSAWLRIYVEMQSEPLLEQHLTGRDETAILPYVNLDPGDYYVHLEPTYFGASSWFAQWHSGAREREQATPIHLEALGDVAQVTMELVSGGRIEGLVRRPAERMHRYWRVGITGADSEVRLGEFRGPQYSTDYWLRGLPDGDYKVGAWFVLADGESEPEEIVWYPGTTEWNAATPLSISAANTLGEIDIDLR